MFKSKGYNLKDSPTQGNGRGSAKKDDKAIYAGDSEISKLATIFVSGPFRKPMKPSQLDEPMN